MTDSLLHRMQIPFWILVAVIILLPAINSILLSFLTILDVFVALLAISFAIGVIIAVFYIVVGTSHI
jgi:hypothetical protein